ncbi:MAG: HD domain-containing protein [Anaerolineae bacterium]
MNKEPDMSLSKRYDDALVFAHEQHREQTRKQSDIPYISHLLAVSGLVLEHGGNETEAIAGLFHDMIEDVGEHVAPLIKTRFGTEVLEIVYECSDAVARPGVDKEPWLLRKQRYLEQLPGKSDSAKLVTSCDKLHNLTTIVRAHYAIGDEIWLKFNGKQAGTRWYYENLGHLLLEAGVRPALPLNRKLQEIGWQARRSAPPDRLT